MRRSDRARGREFALPLIDRCTHGVVAFSTGEETPYCIPLSFVRVENSLYFHCAQQGRKVDLLRKNPRVCVTFVAQDTPDFEEPDNFTTYFQSAVVTGTAVEVTDPEEKIAALHALCQSLTAQHMTDARFASAIRSSLPFTAVWRIDMDEVTGKFKEPNR